MNVEQRREIERRLIQHLCLAMRQAGWIPVAVNDGGEIVNCENDEEVFDTVFSVDESTIIFRRDGVGRKHGVFIVLGNDGHDAICDYSYSENDDFEKVMKEVVDPFAERLEEEGLGAVSPLERAAGSYSVVSLVHDHQVFFESSDETTAPKRIATFINLDDARLFASLKNGSV